MGKEIILARNPKIRLKMHSGALFLEPAPHFCTTLKDPYLTWLKGYAAGTILPLPPFDLSPLTTFQKKVLKALIALPPGNTTSYHALLEDPRYARAIGGACNANPFPLFIPCHRVVGSSSIGGYKFGIPLKKALINYEHNTFLNKSFTYRKHLFKLNSILMKLKHKYGIMGP